MMMMMMMTMIVMMMTVVVMMMIMLMMICTFCGPSQRAHPLRTVAPPLPAREDHRCLP